MKFLKHTAKYQAWGYGLVLEQESGMDKISAIFQDGSVRTFKKSYSHLFEILEDIPEVDRKFLIELQKHNT